MRRKRDQMIDINPRRNGKDSFIVQVRYILWFELVAIREKCLIVCDFIFESYEFTVRFFFPFAYVIANSTSIVGYVGGKKSIQLIETVSMSLTAWKYRHFCPSETSRLSFQAVINCRLANARLRISEFHFAKRFIVQRS